MNFFGMKPASRSFMVSRLCEVARFLVEGAAAAPKPAKRKRTAKAKAKVAPLSKPELTRLLLQALRADTDLHERVLTQDPIEFSELLARLPELEPGIGKLRPDPLREFLEEQGIQFCNPWRNK